MLAQKTGEQQRKCKLAANPKTNWMDPHISHPFRRAERTISLLEVKAFSVSLALELLTSEELIVLCVAVLGLRKGKENFTSQLVKQNKYGNAMNVGKSKQALDF